MRRIDVTVSLACLLAAVTGCSGDGSEAVVSTSQRIVNGIPAAPSDFPSTVAIVFGPDADASLATGSMIDPHHILTCGHCVPDPDFHGTIRIWQSKRFDWKTTPPDIDLHVKQIFKHPFYDLAIVRTETTLPGPFAKIDMRELAVNESVWISGYGNSPNPTLVATIGTTSVKLRGFQQESTHLLEGSTQARAVPGDSGGPILRVNGSNRNDYRIVGITQATNGNETKFIGLDNKSSDANAKLGNWIYGIVPGASYENLVCRTWTETNKTACGPFLEQWETTGGLDVYGYPISNVYEVSEGGGLPSFAASRQYFERHAMEAQPYKRKPYHVEQRLLGAKLHGTAFNTSSAAPGCKFITQEGELDVERGTGNWVCGAFLDRFRSRCLQFDGDRACTFQESLALWGLPIDGDHPFGSYEHAQWFERARMELNPNADVAPEWRVLGGLLGVQSWDLGQR